MFSLLRPFVAPSLFTLLLGAAALVAPLAVHADTGSDDASQSAYGKGTWSAGDNGGSGFQPWRFNTTGASGTQGFFIGDSKKIAGGSGGDINTDGKAFGLFGQGTGNAAEAYRDFSSPLAPGQSFTVDLAVNYRNGNKGLDLRDSGGNTIFNFNVGSDDYVVNQADSSNGSIGGDYSGDANFELTFLQSTAGGGTWSLTRKGSVSKTATGTYKGVAAGFKLYVSGTDSGSDNDLMANKFTIKGGK